MMTIGQQIKKARKKADITQQELADLLGVSCVGVSQWEIGKRIPKSETIAKIVEAMKISLTDFFDFTSEEKEIVLNIEANIAKLNNAIFSAKQNDPDKSEALKKELDAEKQKMDVYISKGRERADKAVQAEGKMDNREGEKITFASQLSRCMTEKMVGVYELAEKLGEEAEVVEKWLDGERFPKYENLRLPVH